MSDLQDFARRMLLSALPEQERVAYIDVLKKLQRDTQERPDFAAEALSGFFGLLTRHVNPERLSKDSKAFASLVILSLYFQHQGNWARMIADFEVDR